MLADLRQRLSVIQDAYVLTIPPPPVQGLGSAGGFKLMLQDRGGVGSKALAEAADTLVAAANKDPSFAGVFTLFNVRSPSIYTDIDRREDAEGGAYSNGRVRHYRSISALNTSMTSTISAGPTR